MRDKIARFDKKCRTLVGSAPCKMGLSARVPGLGEVVSIRGDRSFPLASVYKVPILATVFHEADVGHLNLQTHLRLNENDKSIGSDLEYFDPGLELTLNDLCYLMIVHSDNTATDMIHRFIGFDAPNEYMRSLGLKSVDVYCPNREYFLILLGWSRRFEGLSQTQLARKWKGMTRAERIAAFVEVRQDTSKRTASEVREAAREKWGIDYNMETASDRLLSGVMDNYACPSDISRLLELMSTDQVASGPLTRKMLEYMLLCDSRQRIPARLPDTVLVANKTGTIPGVVNDCAIIFGNEDPKVACACFTEGVKISDLKEVEARIAQIGGLAYEAFVK